MKLHTETLSAAPTEKGTTLLVTRSYGFKKGNSLYTASKTDSHDLTACRLNIHTIPAGGDCLRNPAIAAGSTIAVSVLVQPYRQASCSEHFVVLLRRMIT